MRRRGADQGRARRAALFSAPLLAVLLAAVLLPAVYNTVLAFYRYEAMDDAWRFVGVDNFARLVDAPAFWNAVRVTTVWVTGNVALQLALGLAVALALNAVTRLRALYSATVMVPWVSSFVIVAIVFLWLYHPELGVLNDMLMRLGLISAPIAWLASPELAQLSLMIANTWKFFPLVTITLFAGLQAIPRDVLEAAEIDGAGRIATLRRVVLPMLAPSVATAVLLSMIWSFNAFTLPIIMTGGGPLRATEVMGLYIYKVAFDRFDFGLAAAASLLLFLVILVVTLVYLRLADPAPRAGR
jgi:multiple sugar transport system permease protein